MWLNLEVSPIMEEHECVWSDMFKTPMSSEALMHAVEKYQHVKQEQSNQITKWVS